MADDDKVMGMLCHLLAIFTWIIGPLVIWLIKKDDSEFVAANGRNVLNFTITVTIAMVVLMVLGTVLGFIVPFMFILVFILYFVIAIAVLVLYILGTVKSYGGEVYRYPLALPMLK